MLKTENPLIELGNLEFGKSYKFKFVVTNTSVEPILINKLVVSCNSCTKAYTNKTYLKPGDSSDINASFKPGIKGKQVKSIDVVYNTDQTLKLKFTAQVD